MIHFVDLLLLECLFGVIQHVLDVVAFARVLEVQEDLFVAELLAALVDLALASRLWALAARVGARCIRLVARALRVEHGEGNHQVALVLTIDHGLHVHKRYFLVDDNAVLVLY